MRRISALLLVIILVFSVAACSKQPSAQETPDLPDGGTLVDNGNITYVPYSTEWETVNICIFGDGIITANSFGDLVRLFAETDGFTIDFVSAGYDNTGKAGQTSSLNLYETMLWSYNYTQVSAMNVNANSTSKLRNAMLDTENSVDYFIIDTGRDRNVIGSDYFATGSKLAAVEWQKFYKENCPDGKIVLLAPPAYQDGSAAFDTKYKITADTTSSVSEKAKTSAAHAEIIKAYAQETGAALNNDVTYALMCDAFEFFYENYSDSGIDLYQDDLTFTSTAGSYYMAAVLYGSLFGKSTVGMPVYGYLDEKTATTLQNAAHDYLFDTDPSSVKREVNYVKCLATPADVDQSTKTPSREYYANEIYDENYPIILATAYSYYARGKWIQYDNIGNSNTYAALLRRDIETRAEDATPQNISYLDCSSFVYSVYNNAYGYNFDGANNTNMFLERDTDRVYYWNAVDTDWTDEEAIENFYKTLQPGDVVVYTGHAMLYMGNGMILHCISSQETGSSANYNPDTGVDSKEIFGGIVYEPIYSFSEPTGARFVFKGSNEVAIYRPLASGITPTEEGKLRAEALLGITAYKTTTAPAGITVNNGDTVTITFTVKNENAENKQVTLTDIIPEGLSYVSGDFTNENGSLSLTMQVPAGKAKTASYTVSVNTDVKPATLITCDDAKANGIALNTTLINVMPTLTAEQQAKISDAAKTAAEDANTTMEMIISVYNDTLGKEVSFGDEYTLLKQLLDINAAGTSGIYVYTDDEDGFYNETFFSNDLIPYNLFGGKLFSANSGAVPYTENPTVENILPGDILLLVADGAAKNMDVYFCTAPGVLAAIEDGNYVTYADSDASAIMESVFKYSYFCVARPSMCNREFDPDLYGPTAKTETDTNVLIFGDHLLGLNGFGSALETLATSAGKKIVTFNKAYDSKPTTVASRLEFYEIFSYDSNWQCTGWLAGNGRASAIANYLAENNVEYAVITIGRRDTLNTSDAKHKKAVSAVEWLGKTYPETKFIIVEEPPYVSGTFNDTFTGNYKIGVTYVGNNPTVHLKNIGTYINTAASKITNCAIAKAGTAIVAANKAGIEVYSTEPNYNALPNINGTYLTACVVYKTIFGQSPVGLATISGVDASTAAALQDIAAK